MASATSSVEKKYSYREWINRNCPEENCNNPLWPGYKSLRKFIREEYECTNPPAISIVTIPGESSSESKISMTPPGNPYHLLENLPSLADTTLSSQLIIVENVCSNSLAILGQTYDIDPQFFAEHVNVLSWYKMYESLPERLPSLPSTKREEDFLILKFVETRKVELSDDTDSILWPDPEETRIRQSAGKLEPIPSILGTFPRMAFTRQTVSVWCRKKTKENGWIAIMLVDPPFRLARGAVGQAEYREPGLRPKAGQESHGTEHRQSFSKAFYHLLEQRCIADRKYREICTTDAFLVLYECYRIIASEWLVVNEYVKRELANIENRLEKSEPTFRELEQHLKELYRIRRRCNKDRELVKEAVTQCKKRGQALWLPSKSSVGEKSATATDSFAFVERHAQELEEDFQYVLENMSISISRIEKNITLLMALVTISEGRQGLKENRSIAFLTLIATIFLPSETIATILGIQTDYSPSGNRFWVLWIVSLPLTVLVATIPFLYPVAIAALTQVWEKYGANRFNLPNGSQDEIEKLSKDPNFQMHQTYQRPRSGTMV